MRRRKGAERATQGRILGPWEKCSPPGRNQLSQERSDLYEQRRTMIQCGKVMEVL